MPTAPTRDSSQRLGLWLCVSLVVTLGAAAAADRTSKQLPNMDLPGSDYQIVKGTTLKACDTACIGDDICHAYTFNTKTKWCFLKGDAGTPAAFAGATSGTITPPVPSSQWLA